MQASPHRNGANAHGCCVSFHRLAVMTEAHDIVQLHLTDAEEGNSITHGVTRKAFGTQPRIVERDAQRRIVDVQRCSLCGRRVLDLEQRVERPATFALQGLSPVLDRSCFDSRRGLGQTGRISAASRIASRVLYSMTSSNSIRQVERPLEELYAHGD